MQNSFQLALATPEILLLILACAVLLIDAFSKSTQRHVTFVLSLVTLIILTVTSLWQWSAGVQGSTFNGLYLVDSMSHFLKVLSYIAAFRDPVSIVFDGQ